MSSYNQLDLSGECMEEWWGIDYRDSDDSGLPGHVVDAYEMQ